MFHIKDDQPTVEKSKNLIRKIFLNVSSDKKIATKSDIKTAWIYLFGYKISKVEFIYLV
jgi:ribosomal protein L23